MQDLYKAPQTKDRPDYEIVPSRFFGIATQGLYHRKGARSRNKRPECRETAVADSGKPSGNREDRKNNAKNSEIQTT